MNKVAVVILNYNGRQYLEQFLPSVVKYSKPHEVIIADNCSTDDSVEYLKSNYPSLEIIEIPFNQGYSAGYNYALQKVNSEYYILLNSDIEVTENWIAHRPKAPAINMKPRDIAHNKIAITLN